MRHLSFTVLLITISTNVIFSQGNVGVGTTAPLSSLDVRGQLSNPSIPGNSPTGLLRIGYENFGFYEGLLFGKQEPAPFSAWIQVGFNGSLTDPLSIQPLGGRVGIGNINPHASSVLDIHSITAGLLPPRMTLEQRDAIATPAEGLVISCTDCNIAGLHQYINGSWQALLSGSTGDYGTVVNASTGKVWLDRNLGATQVATSSADPDSYGDLYQWGRNADGHQIRTSGTTSTLADDFFTTNGLFITTSTDPCNWLSTEETHMWSGTAAENNPCPSGFRIPTAAEWNQERLTWSSNNAAGAFASPLKLPMAGYRYYSSGSLYNVGTYGYYWSSTVNGIYAWNLYFYSSIANMNYNYRADGFSVRCIKD